MLSLSVSRRRGKGCREMRLSSGDAVAFHTHNNPVYNRVTAKVTMPIQYAVKRHHGARKPEQKTIIREQAQRDLRGYCAPTT